MNDADRDYCLRRAREERARGASSEAPDVAARHDRMADLYELRVNDPAAWETLSTQHFN